ncbi:Alpha/Beta hydrolase protein [Aspergillus aurantiobrunneus]
MAVKDTIISLGMVIVAVPIILASFLVRRARRLLSKQELPFKEDLYRSISRGLASISSFEMLRHRFKPRPLKFILESKRFAPFTDQLCIRLSKNSCNGYWICKGPPGRPQMEQDSDIVLLWFHGGAYCFGDPLGPTLNLLRVAEVAAERGISLSIFSVEYTLAPTATFPHHQREAVAAYRHLLEEEGLPANRIIIAGDSSGGHLALSCLMDLKNRGLAKPRGALLLYPWVNLINDSPTFESNRHNDVLSKRLLDRCAEAAIGERGRTEALNLEVLINPWEPGSEQSWKEILPSFTWINVGTHDLLLHDIQTFVQRARTDGARVELDVTPKEPHSWNFFRDRNWENPYSKLQPGDRVPSEMMAGSTAIAEGLLRAVYGDN